MSSSHQKMEREPTSCLPEKVSLFTGRETEIQKVLSFLTEEERVVVSLHGGAGFGKTAVAVEVSHKLNAVYNIPVVFSHLRFATTINEMIVRLCRDVGVNYEGDPKSSFILWLKNIKKKVVFVLDDIEKLLEKKTDLNAFLHLMRMNSNQHSHFVTTSKACYSVPEHSISVSIGEMDCESAIELLRQRCPDQDSAFLRKLAQLCGHIPLSLSIAGSRVVDFEDPNKLFQCLENQPMNASEIPESDLFVYRAVNMSYEMLDVELKEALVRLAVFEATFSEAAARAVIEKKNLDAKRILQDLVFRSLIRQRSQQRYSTHLLVRRLLKDKPETEENRSHAEMLMVGFYLNLGHELTIKSYSKDGYKASREAIKKDARNIQHVLKICCQQKDITSDISTSVSRSKVYTNTARFFSVLVRTVIPGSIVDEFLQCCAKLAGERKEFAIKINFDCLLADQERSKSIGKSDGYFKMMEEIQKDFEKHYEDVIEDKSLCAHYYYQYGRYLSRKSETERRQEFATEARKQLEKSLSLTKDSTDTSEGKADAVFLLLHLGNITKMIGINEHYNKQKAASEKSGKAAEDYYKKAIELSQEYLGKHELTSGCYKSLGDYFLYQRKLKMAEENYTTAKEMREILGLHASEKHVYLLNNLGKCSTYSKHASEAIKVLQKACDMAEKLAESDEPNVCKAKVYTSLAIAYNLKERYSENAQHYAKKAMELDRIDKVIKKYELTDLKQILSTQRWRR